MKQSTTFAQVATNLLNVLQGYTKGIRFLLVMFLTLTASTAWGATAEFLPTNFSGQGTSGTGSAISATVNGVTFACNKGYGTTQFRCYGGSTITISSSNTITAISFTFSGSYTGGLATSYINLNTNSWEKDLSSQARITNCVVTYEEASTEPCTVTLVPGSGSVTYTKLEEPNAGAGVTLPTPTLDCGYWKFAGWKTTSAVTTETTTEPTLIPAGNYKPTKDITLYAVYQRIEETEGGGSTTHAFGWENADDESKWTISNFSAKGVYSSHKSAGSYAASTNSKTTGYIQYNEKLSPTDISCKYTKATSNTNSSSKFIIQTSIDGSSWTNVADGATMNNVTLGTFKTLSWTGSLSDVYVRIYYTGTNAVRVLDEVSITAAGGTTITTYYHSTPECAPKEYTLPLESSLSCVTNGSVTFAYNATSATAFTAATRTDYICTGYWSAPSGGVQVLNADGSFAGNDVNDFITDGKWINTTATKLTPRWETEYKMILSKGTEENGTYTLSTTNIETSECATSTTRQVTITATPDADYEVDQITYSGAGTATKKSGPTLGAGKTTWVYTFAENDKGTGTFTVTFKSLPQYTVTWLANGKEFHTQTAVKGTALDLPDSEPYASEYACDNKVFVGWTATSIDVSTDTEPADLFKSKTDKVENAATTYYAVFATAEGTPSTDYAKITTVNNLTDGNYVIAYSYDGGTQVVLKNTTKNTTQMNGTNLSLSSGIYANPDAAYIWQLTKQADDSYYIYNSNANKYLSATTSALQLSDNPTKYNISYDSSNSRWTIVLKDNSTYYMHGYVSGSSYDFRVSTSGSGNKYRVYLYKNASTAVYSDYVTTCVVIPKYNVTYNKGDGATGTEPTESPKAEGATFTLASADGLTKDGYSFAGWLCNHDSKTYNAGEEYTMPAEDVTFTAQWNELPKYTVTFYNKGKKHSEVAQTIANAPIECPTDLVACDGYTFAGWSTEELDGVSSFTKIEGEYTPESDITLYAVYAEGNVTTNGWVKVTDLSTITEGTYALLSNNDYAFNGTISKGDGQPTSTAFVFDGEGVATTVPTNICEIQLIASGSGYMMYNESKGYLYAKAASSGNLEWHATENSSWSWDPTKENWVYADNKAYLRSFNNTFRTYGNSSNNAIYFAKKNTTSFTTSPACDPMITIGSAEPVMVTSANGIRVDAVQNITIAATNLDQNADEAQVSIKIVSDNSAFKFKEVGANGDGQATSTWTGIANATFDKTLCVTYTPTVSGREETATLTVTAYRHNGSTEYATATMQVRGRSLPEQFVLVANTGDGWVALPNTLGTGSTASIPYPIAVEVDNDADPTSIPQAPSTTIYKAAARSSINDVPTGLRFTTEAGGYLQASTSETNIWLSSNNSENMQSWTLNSTDFVDYSIRVNNSAEGAYLNYNTTQKKIGNYKSDNKLRILPVGAVCEQHAAPEDIEASSVRATSATIQWSAVSTATAGYEYRIGDTGEWTKIGNVTELEITGLNSLTNYVVYVRASVEGAIINCSNEAEVSFTTTNCDDVPTNITYTSSSQSITISWETEAETSTVKLYSDKEGTTEVKSIESSSPCTLSDLEKYTTYYVQILAGGDCPSQIIEVSTLIPNINIAEWMTDGILVDVDTDEDVSVVIENEESYGSATGQSAEDLFFSKYFEGSGSLKLLAIYNGTGKDVDLSTYRIDRGSNGNATNISKTYDLSQLGTIKNGQEIIFYSWPLNTSSEESVYSCSQSFLNAKSYESGADANPRWILCDANPHNGVEFEAMDFSGDDPLLFYKDNTLIDVFGVSTAADRPSKKTQCSGRSEESWSADGVTNMDYNKTDADFEGGVIPEGVDLLNPTITAYTARVIMFRKNTVTSGSDAVRKNTTDFVTFADEWEARSVCKSGGDGDLTCAAYQELGTFNYSEYYTKYNTVGSEQVFPGENRTDGTVKITIEGLPNYSCHNIKLNLKIGEDLKLTEITKVPILISDEQTTKITSSTFTTLKSTLGVIDPETKEKTDLTDEQLIEKCETCDIVVLANGKLTHETDGIDQFRDLIIYPEGVFHNTSVFNVNRLLIHAKKDNVGYAIIENEGVSITTDAIAHTKRIDAQYWYPFSLPYNCNIADITQANGEPLGDYGVHWGIQYYDGKKRQESGTSAGIGQSSNFWTPIYNSNEQLKAYQGYMIALFDASVSSPTEMRTIYFPPVSAQMYTESGIDSKETTITSWNVNLEAEKRHHGWNFTGSPYISVFNPQATGLSEDRGLISEVLIVSGHYDQGSNEYLYDDEYVYVSIPSPNGAKYYDQYITSATSLKPFTAYFVQAIDPTSGNDETQTLAYAKAGRELPTSAPRRSTSTRQRVFVELNVTAPDGQTDNTGVWVDDCYNATYEIAADLTKMYVADAKPQLYTLDSNNEKMAYNAIPDENAENVILGLYAPIAGNYTLALNNRVSRLQGAETVELLYNGNVVANLFYEDYVISADKGIVNGYSLRIRRRTLVDSAIDNITGQVMHIMNENGILTIEGIATDAQVSVYDMLGRLVAVQSADGKTNISMPIMTQGVYNVVVGNDYGKTTVKVVLK